jgi:ABC-type multidrug transport system fused ATPase/permease subunit
MSSDSSAQPYTAIPSQSWKSLYFSVLNFIGPRRRQFVFWLMVLIISQSFVLIPPLLIGQIVDFFLHYRVGASLQPFYIDVIILGVSSALAAYIRLLSKDRLGKLDIDTVYQAKVDGFDRLMRYPLSWHHKENTGNKMQRLQFGVQSLRHLLHIVHDDLPALVISFAGVLVIFMILDWMFAAFLIVYLLTFAMVETYFYRKLQRSNHQFNQAAEVSTGTYLESANNVLTIKTMGAANALKSNLDKAEVEVKQYSYGSHRLITKKWQYFQVINAVSLAIFLLIVGHSVVNGAMTAGAVFVYFSYYQRLSDSASNGLTALLNLLEHKSAIERMMPIYDQAPQLIKGLPMPQDWHFIEIANGSLTVKADEQQFTIDNLNLKLRRGEKVGIVGKSGSGKSTLAKLLLGIYQLEKGSITIGGLPLAQIDAQELTKHITIVTQETELFNLSLYDNITMMKEVPPERLQKAIDIACLQPVIDKLPKGLETKVGERGGRLSGGERQRVGIARAICADTEILVLDEATSALDAKTELLVQEAMERELADKTLIMIAHRLMTLNQVDRIVVFDKGRIIEQDAFAALLSNTDSIFHQLYKMQQPKSRVVTSSRIEMKNLTQIYPSP